MEACCGALLPEVTHWSIREAEAVRIFVQFDGVESASERPPGPLQFLSVPLPSLQPSSRSSSLRSSPRARRGLFRKCPTPMPVHQLVSVRPRTQEVGNPPRQLSCDKRTKHKGETQWGDANCPPYSFGASRNTP